MRRSNAWPSPAPPAARWTLARQTKSRRKAVRATMSLLVRKIGCGDGDSRCAVGDDLVIARAKKREVRVDGVGVDDVDVLLGSEGDHLVGLPEQIAGLLGGVCPQLLDRVIRE